MGNDPMGSGPLPRGRCYSFPSGDAVVVVDRRWVVREARASVPFEGVVGGLVGRGLTEGRPELVGTELMACLEGAMESREAAGFEGFFEEGGIWVEVRVWPGGEGGLVVYCRDVTTARAEREKLEVSGVARERFLASLSHELRTPLGPVLMAAGEMEEDATLPAAAREGAGIIRRNVEVEARLIDDLMDLHRVGVGKLRLEPRLVDVHQLMGEALEVAREEILAKRIWLRMELKAGRHLVMADPVRMQQVFWNLLKNAAQFTPAGGTVIVRSFDIGKGTVRVEVQDTGVGMEPGELARVFEAFEQGGGGKRRVGGLGLGLAICKGLVELHGGKVWAESLGPGRGATFAVELPVVAVAVEEEEESGEVGKGEVGKRLTVLVVEDHAATARMLAKVIGGFGHEVATAGSLEEAARAAAGRHFDLLVSDVGLPDGSGLALMEVLRKTDPGVRGITLSGYGGEEDLKKSEEAGFAEHLTKPVGVGQLKEAIMRVVGRGEMGG